jgi:hypothetical protein
MSDDSPNAVLPQWWLAVDLLVFVLVLGGMIVIAPFIFDLHPIMHTDVFLDGGGNGALFAGQSLESSNENALFPTPEHPGGRVGNAVLIGLALLLIGGYLWFRRWLRCWLVTRRVLQH